MKSWTIQFTLQEAWDEFFETQPDPQAILQHVNRELTGTALDFENLKIVNITDDTEYKFELKKEESF